MVKQKQAVINAVIKQLPTFKQGTDIALLLLTDKELELVKKEIFDGIMAGNIEYSKGLANAAEILTYSRSMVMNHLKKAKELNGGSVTTTAPKASKTLSNIDMSLLPADLKTFVESLDIPNEITRETFNKTDAGEELVENANVDDMFKKLCI